jgi:uncharacterized membrane protein
MLNDVLAPIPLFAALSPVDRIELSELMHSRHFAAHQPVVWIGESGDEFFLIRSGHVRVICPDEAGKEVTLGVLGHGHFFGEISLLDGGPRTATVRAETEVDVLVLGRRDFLQFLRRHPDAAVHMLTVLGQRHREIVERVRGIRNVNEAIEEGQTRLQRLASRVAAVGASEVFVLCNLLFFATWIVFNTLRVYRGLKPFDDPPTFFTLGFIITMEAILLSMFVLNSQRQQAERDHIRADLEYQVNVKAHQEVMLLHRKLDALQADVAALAERGPPQQVEVSGE